MASFDIEPSFRAQLDRIRTFVAEEVEALDLAFGAEDVIYDKSHPVHDAVIRPLQQRMREKGLWSCHLTEEMCGQGFGQVRLALHLHGAFGVSNEMPLARMLLGSVTPGIADGPTEVHQASLARDVLKDYHPAPGPWPSEHLPGRRAAAVARYAPQLEV